MAEDLPPKADIETEQHDEVLGKIEQLLNRHRPKPSDAAEIPLLTRAADQENGPNEDGIPTLLDIVPGLEHPAAAPSLLSPSITRISILILRRMAAALDAEHARLREQIGDETQLHLLDLLVAELNQALPDAISAAVMASIAEQPQSAHDARL